MQCAPSLLFHSCLAYIGKISMWQYPSTCTCQVLMWPLVFVLSQSFFFFLLFRSEKREVGGVFRELYYAFLFEESGLGDV